jgi:hypothetical protein
MIKRVLMSIFLVGLASIILTGDYALNCLAANDDKHTKSPFQRTIQWPLHR